MAPRTVRMRVAGAAGRAIVQSLGRGDPHATSSHGRRRWSHAVTAGLQQERLIVWYRVVGPRRLWKRGPAPAPRARVGRRSARRPPALNLLAADPSLRRGRVASSSLPCLPSSTPNLCHVSPVLGYCVAAFGPGLPGFLAAELMGDPLSVSGLSALAGDGLQCLAVHQGEPALGLLAAHRSDLRFVGRLRRVLRLEKEYRTDLRRRRQRMEADWPATWCTAGRRRGSPRRKPG